MNPSRLIPALVLATAGAVASARPAAPASSVVPLAPDRVFTGSHDTVHEGWVVLARGDRIAAVGPRAQVSAPPGAQAVALPDTGAYSHGTNAFVMQGGRVVRAP